ncbi:winged helix-turn-helix transcriptional regulator [Actinocatenispora thailandica]|uniref:winged helix-turn-helix transcriptional regulator n=1 Tax=Actinocatenispora thailandica TaxID=227318 RepID=UPI001EF39472|nr:helix-turn-helix domain-containing protein [Actinocatenispora thailandica]
MRSYQQNCPIALGLDILGDRWTLLILRELVGGPRRYGDIRAELPGIATNLLATRLRELDDAGLVRRTELPAPAARTVLELTEPGWRYVVPILSAVARFGLRDWDTTAPGAVSPSSGFLAGVLLAFDPQAAAGLTLDVAVDVDDRRFTFAVDTDRLAPSTAAPEVTITARSADLITLRTATTAAQRARALRTMTFTGPPDRVDHLRRAFHLTTTSPR